MTSKIYIRNTSVKQPQKASGNNVFRHLGSTGKELDSETGYSYFGARYLDNALSTAWLSVDPMSDKYPSISPYAYCSWNPVKLVDPNGDTLRIVTGTDEEGDDIYTYIKSVDDLPYDERMGYIREINKTVEGEKVIREILTCKKVFTILEKESEVSEHEVSPDGTVIWGKPSITHGGDANNVLAEELYHCYQIATNVWKFHGEMTNKEKLDAEVAAKEFAAKMFIFDGYFRTQGYYVPTQMNIMSGDDYTMKRRYLRASDTVYLNTYLGNPDNPRETAILQYYKYPHKGMYPY